MVTAIMISGLVKLIVLVVSGCSCKVETTLILRSDLEPARADESIKNDCILIDLYADVTVRLERNVIF